MRLGTILMMIRSAGGVLSLLLAWPKLCGAFSASWLVVLSPVLITSCATVAVDLVIVIFAILVGGAVLVDRHDARSRKGVTIRRRHP